jgi:hypothetical protein
MAGRRAGRHPHLTTDQAEEPTMPAIHPVVDEGLGNSAYVVELGDRRALVVDPARDPTPYLKLAAGGGCSWPTRRRPTCMPTS